jgi:Flp pilus assembly protein TadG
VRRGSTLVEFAVVAPLIFSLIFLFVEFDRYVVTVHALKEASRVGCREAVLEGSTLVEVQSKVASILEPFGVDDYTMTITPDLTSAIDGGDPVSVKIDVSYDDIAWLPSPQYLAGKQISVTGTLPKEK